LYLLQQTKFTKSNLNKSKTIFPDIITDINLIPKTTKTFYNILDSLSKHV